MKKIFYALLVSLWLPSFLQACTFWITNDSPQQIILVDQDMQNAVIIPKNKTKTFGDSSKYAKFFIFTQTSAKAEYRPRYKIVQKACTQNKKIEITLQDLENNIFEEQIITVEKINP